MVTQLKEFVIRVNDYVNSFLEIMFPIFMATTLSFILFFMGALMISGCREVNRANASAASIPASVQSYEVPMSDTTTVPDVLHLRPGQSAILMERVVATARIPAQGDELYVGPVVIERGAVVIKPIQE